MARILFDHHSPFLLAHGGFQIQIEQTFKALGEIGVEVDWLRWWDDQQKPDIIHFFGKIHAGYLRFAREKRIKTVINELHTGLGSHPKWKHTLQRHVIGLSKKHFPPLSMRMNWDNYGLPDAIMALTPYEADLMCDIFHAPRERMHVIPNGVDTLFLEPSAIPREDWLLCTAVIHPRKRVLELARAAAAAKIPLRIYGRPYSETDPYHLRFVETVKASGGFVKWEGSLSDRSALADVYRRARGFVLPSTMESLSLSALEAAATNCPLLLSDLPWATRTFGSHATYLPNTSVTEQIIPPLRAFYAAPNPPTGYRVLSWKDVALQLKDLYASLLR